METTGQLLVKRDQNGGWIEFRGDTNSNSLEIVPYFVSDTPEGLRTLKGRLRPIDPSLTQGNIEAVKQFLRSAELSVDGTEVALRPSSRGEIGSGQNLGLAELREHLTEVEENAAIERDRKAGEEAASRGQVAEARRGYQDAFGACLDTGDQAAAAGLFDKALAYYQLGHSTLQELIRSRAHHFNDVRAQIAVLSRIGDMYGRLNRYEEGVQAYEERLPLCDQIDDVQAKARTLCGLGIVHSRAGRHRRAITCIKQAEAILQPFGPSPDLYSVLGNLAVVCRDAGQYRQAIEYHKIVRKYFKGINDRNSLGVSHIGLGNCYLALAQYKRAISYFNKRYRMLDVFEQQGLAYTNLADLNIDLLGPNDLQAMETVCAGLGNSYYELGQYQKALQHFDIYLRVAIKVGDEQGEANANGNIGQVHFRSGEPEKAIPYHQAQIDIATRIGDMQGASIALGNLGIALSSLGDYDGAKKCHKDRLKLAQKIGDRLGEGNAYNDLGHAHFRYGKLQKAENSLRNAITVFSTMQRGLGRDHDDWKITLFESQSKSYHQLEGVLSVQERTDEALSAVDAGRSRALASLVGEGLDETYIQPDMRVEEIQSLARQLETTFLVIASDFLDSSSYYAWVISGDKGAIRTKLTLADPSVLDVSFRVSGTRSFQMDQWASRLCRSAEKELRVVPKKKRSKSRTKALPTFYEKYSSGLQALYQSLIVPIEEHLPEEGGSITILPDTQLQKIPFAVLMPDSSHYLIEKWDISTAPSLEVLRLLAARAQKHSPHEGKCVLSDPRGRKDAPDLKYASDEAATLVDQLGADHFANGSVTTELATAEAQKAGLLHLICHGDPTASESSYSVFAGALMLADAEWHASDIRSLQLKAGLVFMSACSTGRGTEMQEGVIGLSRSFLASGADSVIATHWSIQDASTVPVVKAFYESLLEHGNKAKALREAMLSVIEKWRYQPEKWGAFFLVGLPYASSEGPLQRCQPRPSTLSSNSNS